jgi:hypothetical protein
VDQRRGAVSGAVLMMCVGGPICSATRGGRSRTALGRIQSGAVFDPEMSVLGQGWAFSLMRPLCAMFALPPEHP